LNDEQMREDIARCLIDLATSLTTAAYKLLETKPTIEVDLQHVGYTEEQLGREK